MYVQTHAPLPQLLWLDQQRCDARGCGIQGIFDDVERRAAPVPAPRARGAADAEVDDAKSKKSLSEIYEEAYLRERERQAAVATDPTAGAPAPSAASAAPTAPSLTDDEAKAVQRIEAQLKALFQRLDLLTNFHFTPAEPTPDVQIIANVPAIAVEEKVPSALSDAARLAPEEVYRKPTTTAIVRRAYLHPDAVGAQLTRLWGAGRDRDDGSRPTAPAAKATKAAAGAGQGARRQGRRQGRCVRRSASRFGYPSLALTWPAPFAGPTRASATSTPRRRAWPNSRRPARCRWRPRAHRERGSDPRPCSRP
jgi:hypothetical protein